jgi:uncharacterized Zn-finger protein
MRAALPAERLLLGNLTAYPSGVESTAGDPADLHRCATRHSTNSAGRKPMDAQLVQQSRGHDDDFAKGGITAQVFSEVDKAMAWLESQ